MSIRFYDGINNFYDTFSGNWTTITGRTMNFAYLESEKSPMETTRDEIYVKLMTVFKKFRYFSSGDMNIVGEIIEYAAGKDKLLAHDLMSEAYDVCINKSPPVTDHPLAIKIAELYTKRKHTTEEEFDF